MYNEPMPIPIPTKSTVFYSENTKAFQFCDYDRSQKEVDKKNLLLFFGELPPIKLFAGILYSPALFLLTETHVSTRNGFCLISMQ